MAAPEAGNPASPWVQRFAALIPPGPVLDLACGKGRHSRFFLAAGRMVTGIDIDLSGVADLLRHPRFEAIGADLETGAPWPLGERRFAAVIVTNYLHRPLFEPILSAVMENGLLIYETFAAGNERFGRPKNPAFLLRRGELLEVVRGRFRVLAYEDLEQQEPYPACFQRIAAVHSRD
ncbi:MAG TPA: methyltransferase domain-containing protein [Hypericibacter adhaerens]|jgi:SAM-dependent methyltransferase|nr:class I SAM-dependent methyltransferase [Hypericibacter adhaerens]HWA43534.1 methyltransferase domain-containing protein [Hypericibacter adhaerens]